MEVVGQGDDDESAWHKAVHGVGESAGEKPKAGVWESTTDFRRFPQGLERLGVPGTYRDPAEPRWSW